MEASLVVGILVPSVALICAAGFLFLWSLNRSLDYGLSLAAGFVSIAVGAAATISLETSLPKFGLFLNGTAAMFGVTFLCLAIGTRYSLKQPFALLGVTMVATNVANYFALYHTQNLAISFGVIAVAAGFVCLVFCNSLRKIEVINPTDKALPSVFCIVGALLIADPIVGMLFDPEIVPIVNYAETSRWLMMQMLVVPLLVIIALCMSMMMISDLMKDIQAKADIDSLTGILMRGPYERKALEFLAKIDRTPLPLSMIVCDIDNFKVINDSHGHLIGDAVIASVANVLEDNVRDTDLVGRLGGEEFGILLWNADAKTARLLAEQLRSSIALNRLSTDQFEISCTASFGIAEANTSDTYKTLFARADKALYEAKAQGRNRVCTETVFKAVA